MSIEKRRMIKCSFWSDDYVLELPSEGRLVFIWLLTNEYTNLYGIFKLPSPKIITFGTGVINPQVWLEKFQAEGKVNLVDGYIILTNFLKHQELNPKHIRGLQNMVDELPTAVRQTALENPLIYNYATAVLDESKVNPNIGKPNKPYTKPKPSNPLANDKQSKPINNSNLNSNLNSNSNELENNTSTLPGEGVDLVQLDQELEEVNATLVADGELPALHKPDLNQLAEDFYQAYPRHKEPKLAKGAYVKLLKSQKDPLIFHQIILSKIKEMVEYRDKIVEFNKVNLKKPIFLPDAKYPVRWLKYECWKEELEPIPTVSHTNTSVPRSNEAFDYSF